MHDGKMGNTVSQGSYKHTRSNNQCIIILIFPVPPKGEEKEFLRWKNNGWQPGLLRERLTKLGDDSVVEVPWDENRQEIFKEKMQAN